MLNFQHDDSRIRTAAEVAAGVMPVNYAYTPGDVRRYGAVGDGVTNSTTGFANARLAYPDARFANGGGAYLVTAVNLDGLYGDADVLLNGQRIYIPQGPEELNTTKRLMEKLSRQRTFFQNITLIGDSISDGYYVSTAAKQWFSILRESFNQLQSSGDFETITNFWDSNVPTFTKSGGTAGSTGPLGNSLILAPGDYIEFTGAFNIVDCYFQRAPGAGSLAFAYNTVTYKTASCAGVAANDFNTSQVLGIVTANPASGTHRITCTTANVEVTGLQRYLSTGYTTGQGIDQIRFCRIARQGYSTVQFSSTALLSSIKTIGTTSAPVSISSKQSLFIVAIGTNNAYNVTNQTTPINYFIQLCKIFALLAEAGSIVFISPFQASINTVSGSPFTDYLGYAKAACEAYGVPMIEMNAYDFVGDGYTQDGLHPNDTGNRKFYEIITDALTKYTFNPGPGQTGVPRDLGNYATSWSLGNLSYLGTPNFGLALGAYWDGSNFVATHTQAHLIQCASGKISVYLNQGLTPGNSFTPTLAYAIDGTKANEIVPDNAIVLRRRVLTYSASMTGDASLCNEFDITATDAVAFTINALTNPLDGQRVTFTIRNASGGALGAVTWNAAYKMSAWTQPANGFSRSIDFRYDSTNWVQVGQTGVDVPN